MGTSLWVPASGCQPVGTSLWVLVVGACLWVLAYGYLPMGTSCGYQPWVPACGCQLWVPACGYQPVGACLWVSAMGTYLVVPACGYQPVGLRQPCIQGCSVEFLPLFSASGSQMELPSRLWFQGQATQVPGGRPD